MRHQKKKITLDRKTAARRSLFANLAESLILFDKIKTSKAKGKAVRQVVEKLITKAKANTLAGRRGIVKVLYTKNAVRKLVEQLGPRYKDRSGGYTRSVAIRNRVGDGADEVLVELV